GIDQLITTRQHGPRCWKAGPVLHDHSRWSVGKASLTSAAYGAPSIGARLDHEAARRSRTLRRTEVKRCRGSRATGSAASSSRIHPDTEAVERLRRECVEPRPYRQRTLSPLRPVRRRAEESGAAVPSTGGRAPGRLNEVGGERHAAPAAAGDR